MSTPPFEIQPRHLKATLGYLRALKKTTLAKGSSLFRAKAVKRLWWDEETECLEAKTQGTYLYSQSIEFLENRVFIADCSCPTGSDCKHVAAVLLTLQNPWTGPGEDTEGVDDDYDENENNDDDFDEGEDEDEEEVKPPPPQPIVTIFGRSQHKSPTTRSTSKTKAKPAQVPNPPPAKAPAPLGLAHLLKENYGQKLTAAEKTRAELIDKLFQDQTPKASVDLLMNIAGESKSYRHYYDPPITLWPRHRPPATVLEAWFYVAYVLRKKYPHQARYPLFSKIPWPEVDRLIAPWIREETIQRWEAQLTSLIQSPQLPPPASPQFRLRLHPDGAQIEHCLPHSSIWSPVKVTPLRPYAKAAHQYHGTPEIILDENATRFLRATCPYESYNSKAFLEKASAQFTTALNTLLRSPGSLAAHAVLTPDGQPLPIAESPAQWTLLGPHFPVTENPREDTSTSGDYTLALHDAANTPISNLLTILPGHPNLVLTPFLAYPLHGPPHRNDLVSPGSSIPVAAIESPAGLSALDRLQIPLPARVARRVTTIKCDITVRCVLELKWGIETFRVQARSYARGLFPDEIWQSGAWKSAPGQSVNTAPPTSNSITRLDRSLQSLAGAWLAMAGLSNPTGYSADNTWMERPLAKSDHLTFPDEFLGWLDQRPPGIAVDLDPDLASLRDKGKVSANFQIDLEETGIDWFDLTLNLQVSDIELTQRDIDLLLKNAGSWVRLPGKGWRKMDFEITPEHQQQFADLGLSPADLHHPEKQRLHVLQLAHPAAASLLPAERTAEISRRASDLRTAVTPDLPPGITATLRPYQFAGYHFLAYLSINHFGGILADDMGLGKTLQALTWLAWLHDTGKLQDRPILVICPKSVQDNWTSEASKFYPALPVQQWTSATAGDLTALTPKPGKAQKSPAKKAAPEKTAPEKTAAASQKAAATPPLLLIINYSQLRIHAETLSAMTWSTVILDEAQYIKNPTSLTAKTACSLKATHRLALSGTPIENRLLDLWSIMAFAMPGILGNRAHFAKTFGAKDDPLARRRLSARVRPFLLRRTKKEVAADLPDRIEEDLICTLEGSQQEHYLAELKLARTTLLKAKTSAQLDKLRFNILTSLLRLRQICCHPILTGKSKSDAESAKLNTLLELLEPLIEEGQKVLIFSQFVEMLQLISDQLTARTWPHLILTGATEDRGALVKQFQESEGANLFLISLKAGGSGLNLTAASYVVLFDPWWNPAVENQAIDRTHRIGQVNKVIAYRLITRDTIEEKIRQLQKSKSALASDILGEETFAKALTLDDFQFLLSS
jgi:hypothetical protein